MLSRIQSSLCTTTAQNGTIHYDVGGDFKADGYNALAKDIDVNVAGDITSVTASSTGDKTEGIAYAAIGGGNISVGSGRNLNDLNRDIDKVDEITKPCYKIFIPLCARNEVHD